MTKPFLNYEIDIKSDIYENVNLLKGLKPFIAGCDGNDKTPYLKADLERRPDCYRMLTDQVDLSKHIDIIEGPVTITYDMGRIRTFDRIDIYGTLEYSWPDVDFSLAEFEIYLSDEGDDLYNKKNCVFHRKGSGRFYTDSETGYLKRENIDYCICFENTAARFFGLKIIKPCAFDDVIRLSAISVINDRITEEYNAMNRLVGRNLLEQIAVNDAEIFGDLLDLTDHLTLSPEHSVRIVPKNTAQLVLTSDGTHELTTLSLFGEKAQNLKVFMANEEDTLFSVKNAVEFTAEHGRQDTTDYTLLKFSKPQTAKFTGVLLDHEITLNEVGLHSFKRIVNVDTDKVIHDKFFGYGVNCIPMNLMKEARKKGANDAYFEVTKKRMIDCRPSIVRLWFQLDWFIESGEDYLNGVYNFDSDKMKAMYRYLDAFKEAGSEIEFNFGWKIASYAQKWFSYPCGKPSGSAPIDLVSFTRSCVCLLEELFRRGYDNIKYLTFFNEPQNGDDFWGPFKDTTERGHYFRVMVDYIDWELRRKGLRDRLEIWGPEDGWMPEEIELTNAIDEGGSSPMDMITFHRYNISYDGARVLYQKLLRETCPTGKPLAVTECGVEPIFCSYDTNPVAHMMAITHFGLCGALNWVMEDVEFTDPCLFTMDWGNHYWSHPNAKGINTVYSNFFYQSLYSRYLPAHSKVLFSEFNEGDDIRAAAYETPDGEVVIAIEANSAKDDRQLEIRFKKALNKTFYKHELSRKKHYDLPPIVYDGNAVVPPCVGTVDVGETLKEALNGDYHFILYTTKKPYTQVAVETVNRFIKAGECMKIGARVIDGKDTGFTYSIVKAVNADKELQSKGSVSADGIYTADRNAKPGDTIAVRAELNGTKSYGIAVFTVQ